MEGATGPSRDSTPFGRRKRSWEPIAEQDASSTDVGLSSLDNKEVGSPDLEALRPPPPIIDMGDMGLRGPSGSKASRPFASVPSPLAAAPIHSDQANTPSEHGTPPNFFEATSTMKKLAPEQSISTEHAFQIPSWESTNGLQGHDKPQDTFIFARLPALQPMDMARMTQREDLFAQLGQTASDLSQWLHAIQVGIDELLDGSVPSNENDTRQAEPAAPSVPG